MAENNATILDSIWLNGSNDYQQRVPQATKEGVAAVQKFLFQPQNRNYWNEFVSGLVNRIGLVVVRGRRWENPLAQFKREELFYGDSIEEIATELVKAHGYEVDADTLFKVHAPNSKCAFHERNRSEYYAISVNDVLLRQAFIDDYGLSSYINKIMDIPFTSDNYDEYQVMKQLFAEYEANTGFFKVQVGNISAADASEATAKAFIKEVRKYSAKMKFISRLYNAAGVPVFANPDELVLFVTPEAAATIDVNVLAAAFNVSYAEVQNKIVLIDEFPIAGAQAILASKDWFMCADTVYENRSFPNPETLNTNYYLHHHGIYSCSPFMPAILFTTSSASTTPVVTTTPSAITLTVYNEDGTAYDPSDETLEAGKAYAVNVAVAGTITVGGETYTGDKVVLPGKACTYAFSAYKVTPGEDSDPDVVGGIDLSNKTFVDRYGKLHLEEGIPAGAIVDVVATSTYKNPSGSWSAMTDSVSITIG